MKLKSKVIAITGAGSGIGRASAELFAREGAQVALLEINSHTGKETEKIIKDSGGQAKFFNVDISDTEQVRKAFEDIENVFGRLNVLYNNASVFLGKEDNIITEIKIETWNRILEINLNGLFYCTRCALPLIMRSKGGSIINTASSAGLIGIPKCDAYTATKGAIISLTRSLAVEYGPHNIRVNCIAPAAVYTPMIRESNLEDPDFREDEFVSKLTPLRRWGTPEEIANIALFLASDDSSYLNGSIIVADGGITIS